MRINLFKGIFLGLYTVYITHTTLISDDMNLYSHANHNRKDTLQERRDIQRAS